MLPVTLLNMVVVNTLIPDTTNLLKVVSPSIAELGLQRHLSISTFIIFNKSCRLGSQLEILESESTCLDLWHKSK